MFSPEFRSFLERALLQKGEVVETSALILFFTFLICSMGQRGKETKRRREMIEDVFDEGNEATR